MGSFPKPVRKQALEASWYECAVCSKPGHLEVHHMVPAKEGGPDTLENACPLCPNCHDEWGDNRERRGFLREMRDFRWKQNEKRLAHPGTLEHNQRLAELSNKQDATVAEMKALLLDHYHRLSSEISGASTFQAVGAISGVRVVANATVQAPSFSVQASGRVVHKDGATGTECPGDPDDFDYDPATGTWTAK